MTAVASGTTLGIRPLPLPDDIDDRLARFQKALERHSPLVPLEKIKAHLLLVSAFRVALHNVEEFNDHLQPTDSLRAYLSRGVHRFELWLKHVVGEVKPTDKRLLSPIELPPIDVLMLWHAYMLRPHRLFEAGVTDHPQLYAIGAFPVIDVANLIDPDTFVYIPTEEQKTHWEKATSVAFDTTVYEETVQDAQIRCPYCSTYFDCPWENNGLGYGEMNFSSECTGCNERITHERLCTAIFLKEVEAIRESDTAIISGTLLDNEGRVALPRARIIALEVLKALQNDDGSLPKLKEVTMHDLALKMCDSKFTKLRKDRILYLMRPFTQPSVFRQDLSRAVFLHRQLPIDLHNAGWCRREYLQGPCMELHDAYARYVVFLEMAVYPEKGRIVPSYDVDFIWHTHQMEGPDYRITVIDLFGMYLDHMSMEEDLNGHVTAIENSVKRLKEKFKDRFTVPGPLLLKKCSYCNGRGCSTCGCGPSMTQDFLVDDCLERNDETEN